MGGVEGCAHPTWNHRMAWLGWDLQDHPENITQEGAKLIPCCSAPHPPPSTSPSASLYCPPLESSFSFTTSFHLPGISGRALPSLQPSVIPVPSNSSFNVSFQDTNLKMCLFLVGLYLEQQLRGSPAVFEHRNPLQDPLPPARLCCWICASLDNHRLQSGRALLPALPLFNPTPEQLHSSTRADTPGKSSSRCHSTDRQGFLAGEGITPSKPFPLSVILSQSSFIP